MDRRKDSNKETKVILLAVFLGLTSAALIVMIVLYCVQKYSKRHSILRRLTTDQGDDAVKFGQAFVTGSAANAIAQKQQIPYKVVLSMTTSPKRIHTLHNQLQVIHPSMVDAIEINIPKIYKPTGEAYEIPVSLSSLPKVKIFQLDEDLGPIMKMLPTIERYQSQKAIILSIDDDAVYSTRKIAYTLKRVKDYGYKAVICNNYFATWSNRYHFPPLPNFPVDQGDKLVDIPEGFSMIAYPSWLVNPRQMREFSQLTKDCFQSDDLTIAYSLALNQIPRVMIKQDDVLPIHCALTIGLQGDALHKRQWHRNAYQKCANILEKHTTK